MRDRHQAGLSDLVRGQCQALQCSVAIPQTAVLLWGPGSATGKEFWTVDFSPLRSVFSEQFADFPLVILDLGSLAGPAAGWGLLPAVDAAVLVLDPSRFERTEAERIRDEIRCFPAELLGVVLNRA